MATIVGIIQDQGGAVYDPQAYGAAGDGVTDDQAALASTIAAVPASGGTLVIARPYAVGSSLTFPSRVVLQFQGGGQLLPAAGAVLTVQGQVSAPAVRIFGGGGSVAFDGSTTPVLVPQWWGAVGDGVADDTAALQAAAAALPAAGGTLRVPTGTYKLTGTVTFTARNDLRVEFEGGAWLRQDGGSGYALVLSNCQRYVVREPRVYVNTAGVSGGIRIADVSPRGILEKPVIYSLVSIPAAYVAVSVENHSYWTEVRNPSIRKASGTLTGVFAAGIRFAQESNASWVRGGDLGWAQDGVVVDGSNCVTVADTAFEDVVNAMVLAEPTGTGKNSGFFTTGCRFERVDVGIDIRQTQATGFAPPFYFESLRHVGAITLVKNPNGVPHTLLSPTQIEVTSPSLGGTDFVRLKLKASDNQTQALVDLHGRFAMGRVFAVTRQGFVHVSSSGTPAAGDAPSTPTALVQYANSGVSVVHAYAASANATLKLQASSSAGTVVDGAVLTATQLRVPVALRHEGPTLGLYGTAPVSQGGALTDLLTDGSASSAALAAAINEINDRLRRTGYVQS